MALPWTDKQLDYMSTVIRRCSVLETACLEISKGLGRPVTSTNLTRAFLTRGRPRPIDLLGRDIGKTFSEVPVPEREPEPVYMPPVKARSVEMPEPPPPAPEPEPEDQRHRLFRALKSNPLTLDELCDELGLPPGKARTLIADAQAAGMRLQFDDGVVGFASHDPGPVPQETGIQPVVGEQQSVGVLSDTHYGSKYCLRAQLKDFVHWAYHERGVREIVHPGDVLDGNYKKNGQNFELSHYGLDAQCQDLYENLPELPGLTYHAITGNHDETFWQDTGHDTGLAIERYFRCPPHNQKPRNDLKFYGNRGARINLRGARFHLWHPKSGKSYARTYKLQKLAEDYAAGAKPQITLAGHWHVSAYVVCRGIHMIACPTFQGGGSSFGKSLGGEPEIGGLVLSWEQTAHGTLRTFKYERRAYFEVEEPQEIAAPGVHLGYGE